MKRAVRGPFRVAHRIRQSADAKLAIEAHRQPANGERRTDLARLFGAG